MGKRLDPIVAEAQLMELAKLPPPKAAADLRFSLVRSSRSILDSDNDFSKQQRGKQEKTKRERVRF